MTQKLDYSREEAMQILNSTQLTDEQKKAQYENYMNTLKKNRKNAIVAKINDYARDIPVITKEIYIAKLKEYESDDLSKPFEVIELELSNFEKEMKTKYNEYLQSQRKEEPALEEMVPDNKVEEETFDDTIFSEPILLDTEEDLDEEVKPSTLITDQISVINEEQEETQPAVNILAEDNAKEVIPEIDDEKEKGSASAIILSIIAVIIGIVVMYSIIKLS